MNKHRHPFTTRAACALAAPAIAAAGLVAASSLSSAAGDPPLTCGTVVTTDIRLTADLRECGGSGLVVGASDITIDLAGHVIDGTGTGAGIDNEAGHDNVRIVGGTVREFLFGVHLFQTSGAHVELVDARANILGVGVHRSESVELDRVTAADNLSNGIEINFSDRITVRRSAASGNGQAGIVNRFSSDSSFDRNTVTGNSAPGLVVDGSARVVVARNHVAGNDSDGIQFTRVESSLLVRNRASTNNGDGIVVDERGNTLRRNRADDNAGLGIAAPRGTIDGGQNKATGNAGGDCTGVVCE